jgi:hypothetical protein
MADPRNPGRTAPAANEDILGGEARTTGEVEGPAPGAGVDGAPVDGSVRPTTDKGNAEGEAKPGKDENQAGFLRDREPDRP